MPELRSDNPSFVLHAIDQVKIENVCPTPLHHTSLHPTPSLCSRLTSNSDQSPRSQPTKSSSKSERQVSVVQMSITSNMVKSVLSSSKNPCVWDTNLPVLSSSLDRMLPRLGSWNWVRGLLLNLELFVEFASSVRLDSMR